MNKISSLLNNLVLQEKIKKIKSNITAILSVFVTFMTLYVLMNPAFTLSDGYKLQLNDNYINDVYSWKLENGYKTSFNIKLNFVDSDGAIIDGKNIAVNIDNLTPDGGYTFGSTNKNELINLLYDSEAEVILVENGKYMFDYAEVLVDGTWQRLVLDEGVESKIWCKNCFSQMEPVDKDYGWRGSYGTDSVEYIINENTEYRLNYIFEANEVVETDNTNDTLDVTPVLAYTADTSSAPLVLSMARAVTLTQPLSKDNSVDSLNAQSGITFKIYNYSGTNDASGSNDINSNGLFDYFAFRDGHITNPASTMNPYTDEDGFKNGRVHVYPTLDGTKNPVFNCVRDDLVGAERNLEGYDPFVPCSGLPNTSFGYLFGNSTNALNQPTQGVTAYNPVNTPLKNVVEDGVNYFVYDSNTNAVDYDTITNEFILRNYTERGYMAANIPAENHRYEFLPFNYREHALYYKAGNSYTYEKPSDMQEIDHWFGMTMQFDFYMPEGGQINGQDMIFSFAGDDDVWVFIDDVLILDLGGTHGVAEGYINFHTGEITGGTNWNNEPPISYSTNIATRLAEAEAYTGVDSGIEMDGSNTTYKDYSKHTLKFFYLERGAAVSNCKIRFNIPAIPAGSLTVNKQFEGTEKYNDEYTFALYDASTNSPVPNGTKYTLGGVEYTIDNDRGEFKLNNNETAVFVSKTEQDDPEGNYLRHNQSYYVKEVNPGNNAEVYSCTLNGTNCGQLSQSDNFVMTPSETHAVVFKNKTKTYNLNVSKEAINSYEGELFDFQLTFKDENGNVVNANDLTITAPNGYNIDQTNNGIVTFQLETAQNILVTGIPINTVIDIKELNHDGYHTSMKAIENDVETALVQGDSYTIEKISENKDIKVYNTPGVVLPETGGIGTLIYIVVGLSMVLASAVLSIAFIRSSKESI